MKYRKPGPVERRNYLRRNKRTASIPTPLWDLIFLPVHAVLGLAMSVIMVFGILFSAILSALPIIIILAIILLIL